jgi:dihydrofolate reductase
MKKVICGISMSIDGFVAGSNLSEQKPFGDIPSDLLYAWRSNEPDKHQAEWTELILVAGAYIMGRNMYGPPGESYDKSWKGWWGDNPPYHTPVYVLTHRSREPIQMEGGTTFVFVTDGIEEALKQAQKAAGDKPVSIGGGASVVNQFLAAGLIDELWLHIVPVIIGEGKRLFEHVPNLQMEPISISGTKLVTHIKYKIVK